MNRRTLAGIILVLSLIFVGSLLRFSGNSERFSKLFISNKEAERIISTHKKSDDFDLSSIRINDYAPILTENEIYYSIIENDKNPYNPRVNIEHSLSIAFWGNQINAKNIENNIHPKILIYDDKNYCEYELVATTLPVMSLDFEDGSVPENRNNKKLSMTLFDNREAIRDRTIVSDGKAHRRGGTSYYAPKANMSLKLTQESVGNNTRKNNVSLLGMQERSEYVLAGMYYDWEKVRDVFGTTIWREMSKDRNSFGLDLGYDWRYIELIANGEYQGMYLLGYKPDETMFQINTEGEHPDILFKAAEGMDFSNFILGKTDTLANYELKSDTEPIYSYNVLREYMRAMFGEDKSKALEWTDFDNAIDFWLFANITQNDDIPRALGMYKNTYFCFKWDGEKYKAIFVPWDHDIGMGTYSLHDVYYERTPDQNVILNTDYVALLHRTNDPEIDWVINNRYKELRRTVIDKNRVNSLIDDMEKQIFGSGAFLRNSIRWPDSHSIDPETKLDLFRNFAKERFAFTDSDLFSTENQVNPAYEIPNHITVFLRDGTILSPEDPNYYSKYWDDF